MFIQLRYPNKTAFVWTKLPRPDRMPRNSFPSNRDNYAAYQFGILMSYAAKIRCTDEFEVEHGRMRPPLWRKLAWLIAVS